MKNKKEKKNKKSRKGGPVGALLLALIIAAVLFLMNHFGIGFGTGDGDGDGADDTNSQDTVSVQEVEPAVVEYTEIEVVIAGDKYRYNGGEYELDALIDEIVKLAGDDKNIKVNISQENGLADALDALIKRLESENMAYTDNTAEE